MVHQLPTHREILKFNRHLPDEFKHCSVALEFTKQMPVSFTENFYRVRMTRNMLGQGEDDFWIPEILQPDASGLQICLMCGNLMKRVGMMSTTCINALCEASGRIVINGPKRGVHTIKTEFVVENFRGQKNVNISFVVGREWKTIDMDVWINVGLNVLKKKGFNTGKWNGNEEQFVDAIRTYLKWPEQKMPIDITCGCLVILDRRYSDGCLCAVWRTCGTLCDMMGVKLK